VPFDEGWDVVVKEIDEKNWELILPLAYRGTDEFFVVPSGMRTDFASVPRVFVWFLPQYGRYTKAAILHDYLWRERAAKGTLRWLDADAMFRRAMRELDVAFLRRWIMWAAVRWAALTRRGGWAGWWKESWRVLLVTLVALPIVLPPAVLILLSLMLFFLLELIVWVPIRVSFEVRKAIEKRRPPKEVKAPRLDWKLS
jgi:Protein of unknown function (DUF1353)